LAHPAFTLAFIDVANHVFLVAAITLAILILALLAAALERFVAAVGRADDILVDAIAGMERTTALRFYGIYQRRTKNVGIAWVLSVVLGPFGAYAYLGYWGRAAIALITLNGLGGWWIESWFSIPQIVLMDKRALAENALAQLPFVLAQDAVHAPAGVRA
jgi:hypothetical protein